MSWRPGNCQSHRQLRPLWLRVLLTVCVCVCLSLCVCVCVRVRLSKRRAKVGAPSSTNAVLVCKHRDMNEKELEAQVSAHVITMSEISSAQKQQTVSR